MGLKIHPTALVAQAAEIGEDVEIGPFTIVHPNVSIGKGTKIGSHCELGVATSLGDGSALRIGENSLIRSHSVFYESSVFGAQLVTGHRVTVRENTRVGLNLQIGTLCDLQGDCMIGDYVRFHSNVHIGKTSTIGNFVWIFPYVVLTNDPHPPSNTLKGVTIEDFAAVATMAVLLPGVRVGEGALIGAMSSLKSDAEPHSLYLGSPATWICPTGKIKLQDGSGKPAYPWTEHFHRGYPPDVIDAWRTGALTKSQL
jgi:acyl-[acyl carrier protein]--UDP-N-acetylglucosamine O-acyltransferase